jgi:autophagy-related protein 17
VQLFVAAKRSLNTQTVLWRANQVVTDARKHLEDNAVIVARVHSLRAIVEEQKERFQAVRYGIDKVELETQAEFKRLLHDLDASFAGLQSTLAVLRDTRIEACLQPPGTPQKHLLDFIDNSTVTNLKDSLRACIDRYNEARSSLHDTTDSFDASIADLVNHIDNIPGSDPVDHPSPVPGYFRDLEEHARQTAKEFESLVRHYDLCVTALKHTRGGSAAATEAVGDAVQSGNDLAAPPEPMTEEERQEMMDVLQKDSGEVDEVVAEIRERESEMSHVLVLIESHLALLREQDAALAEIVRLIANIAADARYHVGKAKSFKASWEEDTRPSLINGIEEWETQRDFYERFDLAYANLLVEIGSRRRRHEKAKRRAEEAQKELEKLYAEDEKAREQFKLSQGDFLPLDIWPGLRDRPVRYEVRVADSRRVDGVEGTEEDEDDDLARSIPQLPKHVVERALVRVSRKM